MVDFVTSLHATCGRKLVKLRGSVEDAVFNENANGKHQKTENEKRYKMAISVFQNFGFLTPKISKKMIFGKMDHKIQNFQNFKKGNICSSATSVVYQCTQFQVNSSIYYPQMECFCLRNHIYAVIFSNAIFVTSGGRMQKQMTPLDSWVKTGQNKYLFVHMHKCENLTFLTWPWPDLRWKLLKRASDDQTNVTIEFYSQNRP